MFLSSLPKYISKNTSLGVRSLKRADKNEIRFVLKLEFDPKNKLSNQNKVVFSNSLLF